MLEHAKVLIDYGWGTKEELETLLDKDVQTCIDECQCPKKEEIFNAFNGLKPEDVKVIIIGQDPYPNINKAHGLAFSFRDGNIQAEDSLKNIFIEIKKEYPTSEFETTNLKYWKNQGVLLLNSSLTYSNTIRPEISAKSWSPFINHVISRVISKRSEINKPLVIMLWGEHANLIDNFKNDSNDKLLEEQNIYVLRASHPCDMSKNYTGNYQNKLQNSISSFVGCNHFNLCNKELKLKGEKEVNWGTKKLL